MSLQCDLNGDSTTSKCIVQSAFLHWKYFVVQQHQEQREIELHRYVQQLEDQLSNAKQQTTELANIVQEKIAENQKLNEVIATKIKEEIQHERVRRTLHEQVQGLCVVCVCMCVCFNDW